MSDAGPEHVLPPLTARAAWTFAAAARKQDAPAQFPVCAAILASRDLSKARVASIIRRSGNASQSEMRKKAG